MAIQKTNLIMSVLFVLLLSFGAVAQTAPTTQEIYDGLNTRLIAEQQDKAVLTTAINNLIGNSGTVDEGQVLIQNVDAESVEASVLSNDIVTQLNAMAVSDPLYASFVTLESDALTLERELSLEQDRIEGYIFIVLEPQVTALETETTTLANNVMNIASGVTLVSDMQTWRTQAVTAESTIPGVESEIQETLALLNTGDTAYAQFTGLQTRMNPLAASLIQTQNAINQFIDIELTRIVTVGEQDKDTLRTDVNNYVSSTGTVDDGQVLLNRFKAIATTLLGAQVDIVNEMNSIQNYDPRYRTLSTLAANTGTILGELLVVEDDILTYIHSDLDSILTQAEADSATVTRKGQNVVAGTSISHVQDLINGIHGLQNVLASIDAETQETLDILNDANNQAFTTFVATMEVMSPGTTNRADFTALQTRVTPLPPALLNLERSLRTFISQEQSRIAQQTLDLATLDPRTTALESDVQAEIADAVVVGQNAQRAIVRITSPFFGRSRVELQDVTLARQVLAQAQVELQDVARLRADRDSLLVMATAYPQITARLQALDDGFSKAQGSLQGTVSLLQPLIAEYDAEIAREEAQRQAALDAQQAARDLEQLKMEQKANLAAAEAAYPGLENELNSLVTEVDTLLDKANKAVADKDESKVAALRQEIASVLAKLRTLEQKATTTQGTVSALDLGSKIQSVILDPIATMKTSLNTADNNLAALVQPLQCEVDLADLEQKYEDFKDDFRKFEDDYEDAKDDDDEDDLEDAKDDLDELRDDLKDLRDDVEDFEDDVDDDKYDDCNIDLDDEIEDLNDDIDDLINDIDDIIGSKSGRSSSDNQDSSSTRNRNTESTTTSGVSSTSIKIVEDLLKQFSQSGTTNNNVESSIEWEDTRYIAWLVAGIIIVAAFVIFLLGLLITRR